MNEAARLLRYAVPGALFLLLYGVWFLIDSHLRDNNLTRVSAGTAALVGGAAIPVGLVVGMIAAEITWCPWLHGRLLRTIDNRRVARRHLPDVDDCDAERLVGIVDVRIHEAYRQKGHPHTLHRLRSLTDLYQGLGHGAVAAVLALLLIVATAGATCLWPSTWPPDGLFVCRSVLVLASALVCFLIAWGMCRSHQRVVRIVEAMAGDILQNAPSVRTQIPSRSPTSGGGRGGGGSPGRPQIPSRSPTSRRRTRRRR